METCASLRDLAAASKRNGIAGGALPAAIDRIALPDPEIEAWLARLDLAADQVSQYASLLSGDERLRADRFALERDRRRFVVARGMLRLLLGIYLDMAPAAIAFGYAGNGKPFVADRPVPIHFNVSHAEERALYAFSRSCALGVDIEYLNREVDYGALATRFFSRREHAEIQRCPAADRKRAFIACWTRKEAVVKAVGDGLPLPLDRFEVTVAPGTAPRILDFGASAQRISDWDLYALDVGSDYLATVAAYRGK